MARPQATKESKRNWKSFAQSVDRGQVGFVVDGSVRRYSVVEDPKPDAVDTADNGVKQEPRCAPRDLGALTRRLCAKTCWN